MHTSTRDTLAVSVGGGLRKPEPPPSRVESPPSHRQTVLHKLSTIGALRKTAMHAAAD